MNHPQIASGLTIADSPSDGRLTVVDGDAVGRFLQEEPDLTAVIREAGRELVKFIPDARLSLRLLADPDYGEGEHLFLGVLTSLPEDDALRALRRFDQGWWVQNVRRARGLLCVDLSDE